VNSQDEAAKVTLTAAESDKVLTWGWNQTRNASGLYAADITINDLEAVKFDYSGIKNALTDAIKQRSKSSIIELVGEIYNTVAGDKFPRLALKYTSSDDFFGTRTVRTGYEFGVTAIKPLSYDFDVHIGKTPYLNKVEKIIYKLINKIKINFPQIDTDIAFEITDINVGTRTFTIFIPAHYGYGYNWDDGNYYYGAVWIDDQYIKQDVSDLLQEFQDDELAHINADLATINDLIAQIQEINNLQVQFDNAISDIKSAIHAYFKKADKIICKVVNSTNKALQPVLLVKEGDKIKRASNSVAAGTITLIPTSYTAEIIAPAFKKFIKVECDGQEVLNTGVIDGSINEVELAVEAGKTYKVTYDALDFFGKQRSNTYVISAK
jgi:hypothetical protein